MPQPDRAWWDDVQYLREPLERKREKEARRGLRLDARAAARAVAERHAGDPIADPDTVHELDAAPRRRFERSAPERRGRFSRAEHGPSGRARRPRRPRRSRRRRAGARWRSPGAPSGPRRCRGLSRSTAAGPPAGPPSAWAPAHRIALGRRPGLLPHLRRGDELVSRGYARAQRDRGRQPGRPPAARPGSHGDAARYPPAR